MVIVYSVTMLPYLFITLFILAWIYWQNATKRPKLYPPGKSWVTNLVKVNAEVSINTRKMYSFINSNLSVICSTSKTVKFNGKRNTLHWCNLNTILNNRLGIESVQNSTIGKCFFFWQLFRRYQVQLVTFFIIANILYSNNYVVNIKILLPGTLNIPLTIINSYRNFVIKLEIACHQLYFIQLNQNRRE